MFLKILAILATAIVVIFSTLILIGLWVGPDVPSLPVIGPEDAEDRVCTYNPPPTTPPQPNNHPVTTTNLELPTLPLFLRFASSGRLPNGSPSPLPLFPAPELARLARPYAEWAPKPFSELPAPALVPGFPGGVSPGVMIRVAHVMSGMEEIVRGVVGREVERSFRVVKAKVSCLSEIGFF
jgi:hypothetical protein